MIRCESIDFSRLANFLRVNKIKSIIAIIGLSMVLLYCIVFLTPKQVSFTYANDSCAPHLTFFPELHATVDDSKMRAEFRDVSRVGSLAILSTSTCFVPTDIPEAGEVVTEISPWGGYVARKRFNVNVESQPVADVSILSEPVSAFQPLSLALDKPDEIFDYTLSAHDKHTKCDPEGSRLSCDLLELGLSQGGKYEFELIRSFNDSTTSIASGELQTVTPLRIKKTSVKNDATVYNKPRSFQFDADKAIESAEVSIKRVVKGDELADISSKVSLSDKKLTVKIDSDLQRGSSFVISVDNIKAKDGSTLAKGAYSVKFRTSGGPRLEGASVGSSGVSRSGDIVLRFDQPLSLKQDISQFISVSGVRSSLVREGSTVRVSYSGSPKCHDIKVSIKTGLESRHGVKQTKANSFTTRTVCHDVQTIGYSRQGRPIVAYIFGNGDRKILFTGAIHGNEKSSYYTMRSWVDDLEANARKIPKNKQVIVVPMMNPDGFYVYGRNNAKKVNLNRNFPTSNWERDIKISGGRVDKGGGGASAGSEPETKALMNLTGRISPYLTVTYHSSGSLVNSNDAGRSVALGRQYANGVGYMFVPNSATTATFGFEMTGTYEDWMLEVGRPAILIELNNDSGNFFYNHSRMMWAMVGA